jgi:hypothetical protein
VPGVIRRAMRNYSNGVVLWPVALYGVPGVARLVEKTEQRSKRRKKGTKGSRELVQGGGVFGSDDGAFSAWRWRDANAAAGESGKAPHARLMPHLGLQYLSISGASWGRGEFGKRAKLGRAQPRRGRMKSNV